jgi:hypothetical protein
MVTTAMMGKMGLILELIDLMLQESACCQTAANC